MIKTIVREYKHLREVGVPRLHALVMLPRYVYVFNYKKHK